MNRLASLNLSRSLIRCAGAKTETSQFLQGMVTNDLNHLSKEPSGIYALFLNKAGRILYDSIIYKAPTPDPEMETFLIECDSSIAANLAKHLKLYRVRKKIDISISDEHDLWSYHGNAEELPSSKDLLQIIDPRLADIGSRIVSSKGFDLEKSLGNKVQTISFEDYTEHRYKLGICEGVVDLPPEKGFPLEANCDYMHGVSFHKGCYIGKFYSSIILREITFSISSQAKN